MGDILSRFAFIGLVIVLFLGGINDNYKKMEDKLYISVRDTTDDFYHKVKTSGVITRQEYDEFLANLGATSRNYDVKLLYKKSKAYPLKPTDSSYTAEKPWIVLYDEYRTDIILKNVYGDPQIFKMGKGDFFQVEVTDISTKGLFQVNSYKNIHTINGGMITNEVT